MYKHVFVSLKKDFIRVYTGYRTESWIIIHSNPIYVLPIDEDVLKIKDSLIDCFAHSREISKVEEDEQFYLGNTLLKLLKEKSWKSSYKAKVCQISFTADDGFKLRFSKYDSKSNSSPVVREEDQGIDSIDGINVGYILEVLKGL